jgi:hypothetical protein
VLSILVFSLVADQATKYGGSTGSELDFVVFTGVTAFLICLAFMVLYLMDLRENSIVTLVELVINVIWWIFWLAAAACLASLVDDNAGTSSDGRNKIKASCAFAWITLAVWSLSCLLNVREVMAGRGITQPGAGATPAVPGTSAYV